LAALGAAAGKTGGTVATAVGTLEFGGGVRSSARETQPESTSAAMVSRMMKRDFIMNAL
jgi:hypothetical protein